MAFICSCIVCVCGAVDRLSLSNRCWIENPNDCRLTGLGSAYMLNGYCWIQKGMIHTSDVRNGHMVFMEFRFQCSSQRILVDSDSKTNKQIKYWHAMHTNQLKIDSICGLWYFYLFSLSPGHSLAASLMFKCQCCASNAIQPSLSSGHSPSLHSMNPFQFANETYWITFRCDSIS